MTDYIRCVNYHYSHGPQQVLRGINFSLGKGEALYLLGPNGSGKSTLLKSIMGLCGKSGEKGEILLSGKLRQHISLPELALLAAYLPQPGHAIPPFTVIEFIRLGFYAQEKLGIGFSAITAGIEALEKVDLANYANTPLCHLSGGQRQRAYLAAALARKTPILLLDEPDSFLDPSHILEFCDLLKKIVQENETSVIMATHNLWLPFQTHGKILLLKDGERVFFGESAQIAAVPAILESAFGCEFHFIKHPKTGNPIPLI